MAYEEMRSCCDTFPGALHGSGTVPCVRASANPSCAMQVPGCTRGVYHDHPELRMGSLKACGCFVQLACSHDPAQYASGPNLVRAHARWACLAPNGCDACVGVGPYGAESAEMAAAKRLVAEKDREIQTLKNQLRAHGETIARQNFEIAKATDRSKDEFLDAAKKMREEYAARDTDALRLLHRCRPMIADLAGTYRDARYLAQDIKKFLEPEAAKKPTVADRCLSEVFGVITKVDHEKKRITIGDIGTDGRVAPIGGPYPAQLDGTTSKTLRYVKRPRVTDPRPWE